MSSLSNRDSQRSPTPRTFNSPATQQRQLDSRQQEGSRQDEYRQRPSTPPSNNQKWSTSGRDSPAGPLRERALTAGTSSRPMSMVQTYQPPLMELNQDTLPELQPIFTYLNSHSNKLYQEGYFLKLDDQNSRMQHFSSGLYVSFMAN
jgi:CCR4-NOT transcriptional complex subunit CAF120